MRPDSHQQKGPKLMRLLMFTAMISSMSAGMFNVVLPQISQEFHLSIAEVSWLSTAYSLIYAFGTVTYGKLSDRFQLKSLLTFGLILFAVGSLIGLISQTFWVALLGRCLQSAGASAIPALAMMIPIRYYAPEKRGSAIAMMAVGLALGSALAPVFAAGMTSVASWRWLFFPSLLVLVLLPFYRRHLEYEPKNNVTAFDWLGGLLLALTVSTLLFGITNHILWYLALSAVALILFILRIRTAREAFIQPRLFRSFNYTTALVLGFLINCIGMALYFLTPILLSDVYHLESAWIGFAMVPAAIVSSMLGRKGGKLADKKGNTYLFTIASSSLIFCFILLSIFVGISPLWISLFLIFGNVGQSFMLVAMSNFVSTTLPKDQAGVGMGLFSMIGFISQGVAAGMYSIVSASGAPMNWNPLHLGIDSALYSNVYLVLAVLYVGILMFFQMKFRTKKPSAGLEHMAKQT
ncbi:MFS transporter [Paenibacillus guangzhouensis]|uniref:MFS transporter n=1 Tax=Paenibacillus guangzhouensis TaxID=1473112 RepID=UPI0012669608|nr:MFS transporter [Paenibacillus guangzhouensis]